MAIKKKTATCTGTTALTQTIDLGAAYAKVHKFTFLSNTDTSVSAAITDAEGVTVFTLVSGDYTAAGAQQLPAFYVEPVEEHSWDTAGEVSAAASGLGRGVVAASPLTVVAAGLDATETLAVAVYVEV